MDTEKKKQSSFAIEASWKRNTATQTNQCKQKRSEMNWYPKTSKQPTGHSPLKAASQILCVAIYKSISRCSVVQLYSGLTKIERKTV